MVMTRLVTITLNLNIAEAILVKSEPENASSLVECLLNRPKPDKMVLTLNRRQSQQQSPQAEPEAGACLMSRRLLHGALTDLVCFVFTGF